jgi:hypothetical protein
MDSIFDSLIDVFTHEENIREKKECTYLDIKNGKIAFKIGYPDTLDPLNPNPAIILDNTDHHADFKLWSSSIPNQFNFSAMC